MSMLHYDDPLASAVAPQQPTQPLPAQHQAPQPIGMFDQERERPGLYAALYGAAIALSLLASHFAARGA